MVVQVQLPPAPLLAMLLQLTPDAASLVEPWLRWAGVEARCLPLQHGRWQVCLRLAGPLPTVLAALQGRDASEHSDSGGGEGGEDRAKTSGSRSVQPVSSRGRGRGLR